MKFGKFEIEPSVAVTIATLVALVLLGIFGK